MSSDTFNAAPLPVAPLDHPERLACLRLIRSENIGPVEFRRLINLYGGATQALEAVPELARRGGRRRIRICDHATAEAELATSARIGSTPLFTIEPGYPAALAAVDHPPPMVYVRGRIELLNHPGLAIVGSRNCSSAGHALARQLATGFGAAGIAVISGLARGIDGAAHAAALDTGTVAVVAGGIDKIYPPEHADLHDQIANRGCLVSEMPPGFQPRAKDFPRRNRIISGMSYGVVIVEAARRSGTLITARLANEQGREVFVVPGHPLDPRAEGTNRLIKAGATVVTSADDVLDVVRPMLPGPLAVPIPSETTATDTTIKPVAPPVLDATSDAQRQLVEDALGPAPLHIDEVLRATGLSAQSLQIALLELSLAGRLEYHGAHLISLRFVNN